MSDIIPAHNHCQMCGKSIPINESICSEDCKQRYQIIIRRRKIMVYFMYGMLAALIVIFVIYGR